MFLIFVQYSGGIVDYIMLRKAYNNRWALLLL